MQLPLYQIDAFAGKVFAGNPAAVCPLDAWLGEEVMQAIALENNLSETAFVVPNGGDYDIRWFTPEIEADLCGHATLASAYVILNILDQSRDTVRFHTRRVGDLEVRRDGDFYVMDLPAQPPSPIPQPDGLGEALGAPPDAFLAAVKNMAVYEDPAIVRALQPDLGYIAGLERDGLIVTAPGEDCDFISRYFAPHAGIPEDPVTGSAHCTLTPYWADRLGKSRLVARQVSKRIGELICEQHGSRVSVAGRAVLYLEGAIHV